MRDPRIYTRRPTMLSLLHTLLFYSVLYMLHGQAFQRNEAGAVLPLMDTSDLMA